MADPKPEEKDKSLEARKSASDNQDFDQLMYEKECENSDDEDLRASESQHYTTYSVGRRGAMFSASQVQTNTT